MEKILVLAPHTDDESLGCGGTIARMVEEGKEVFVYCWTHCGSESLAKEFHLSCALLETKERLSCVDVRMFHKVREFILQDMVGMSSFINFDFDTVFVPSTYEIHQDHQVITQEAIRAFKNCTILGYELPWNNISSGHQCTIPLTKEHVEKKVMACMEYKSQAHRPYMDPEFLRSWAKMRGVQNGCEFAEVFEVIKLRL